jgi:hypothetical protein
VDAPTRAEDTEKRRSEKSEQLVSYMPGKVERLLLAFEQSYLAERIFNPPRGVFARLAGMPEGQGFQAGPAYRYSTHAAALTATSAISLIGAWEVTARLDMPQPGPTASRFWSLGGKFHRLPEEDFYGLGQGTTPEMRTNYLLDETIADVTGGVSPVRWFTLGGTAEYRAERPGSGRDPRSPSIETVHRVEEVPGARIDLDYVRLGASSRVSIGSC